MYKQRVVSLLTAVVLLSLVVGSFQVYAQDQKPDSSVPGAITARVFPPSDLATDLNSPQRGPDGLWYMNGENPNTGRTGTTLSPQSTGGPDDFGYTWNDGVPLNWINASGGSDSGINSNVDHSAAVNIGFSFKYYENTYTQLYISRYGFVSFNDDNLSRSQGEIPSADQPNDVIAPHWVPGYSFQGYIRYQNGGTGPNRWLVVEWNKLVSADEVYTFEVVLNENGDIVFQYGTMTFQGGYDCQSSGIEDSTGLDGLSVTPFCNQVAANHAVRIYRPALSARVGISPLYQGKLSSQGTLVSFEIPIRNTGELGVDTYDFSISSAWSVSLFGEDGTTALSDHDADLKVDTGPVAQGSAITIVAKIQIPPGMSVGVGVTSMVTVCSSLNSFNCKTVNLQTAVPTSFAQIFQENFEAEVSLYLAQPGGQALRKTPASSWWGWGDSPAIAEAPNGNFVFVASTWSHCMGSDCSISANGLEYSLTNKFGETIHPTAKLTDNSTASVATRDYSPAIAVAPNGQIGVVWYRELYRYENNTYSYNFNIYFAVLNPSGNVVYGPINLTNNPIWGIYYSGLNVPRFDSPQITATGNNQFMLAWQKSYFVSPVGTCASYCSINDLYYSVRGSNGGEARSITQLTHATGDGTESSYSPNLTSLVGNRFLLTWSLQGDISYVVLNSAGDVVKAMTQLSNDYYNNYDDYPDAVQLSNGKIVVAWSASSYPNPADIRFAVLDSAYNLTAGPTPLNNPAAQNGNNYVSVTGDDAGRAVLTWMDNNPRRNLYYALVSHTGSVLTQPMIFRSSQAGTLYMATSTTGYGNTSYSTIPSGVDAAINLNSSLIGGAPGGQAQVVIHYANQGQEVVKGVVLTATLASGLTYEGDTSGTSPTTVGNTLTWNLPDLNFLDQAQFVLSLGIPEAASIGTRYPVSIEIKSDGVDGNLGNNTTGVEVMAALQIFIPAVNR